MNFLICFFSCNDSNGKRIHIHITIAINTSIEHTTPKNNAEKKINTREMQNIITFANKSLPFAKIDAKIIDTAVIIKIAEIAISFSKL